MHTPNDWVIEELIARGYSLDAEGQVLKPNRKIHRKTSRPKKGYVYGEFRMEENCKKVTKYVLWSRLVCWLAYGPPPQKGFIADHRDKDRLNNHPSNLRWISQAENMRNISEKAHQDRVHRMTKMTNDRKLRGGYKLNDELADEIRSKYHIGGRTMRSLAEEYGVSPKAISSVVHFRSWTRPNPDPDAPVIVSAISGQAA